MSCALQSMSDDIEGYMAHQMRAAWQENGKARYVKNMSGRCAYALSNFMMKLEPKLFTCAHVSVAFTGLPCL